MYSPKEDSRAVSRPGLQLRSISSHARDIEDILHFINPTCFVCSTRMVLVLGYAAPNTEQRRKVPWELVFGDLSPNMFVSVANRPWPRKSISETSVPSLGVLSQLTALMSEAYVEVSFFKLHSGTYK